MIYLDTNVIISYIDENDPNHEKAIKLLNKLNKEEKITSQLTLLELTTVYSRAGLENPIPLAIYSIRKADTMLIEADLNQALKHALKYTSTLKLKTLDLLHVIIAKLLEANAIISFDKNIIEKADLLKNVLNLKYIPPD